MVEWCFGHVVVSMFQGSFIWVLIDFKVWNALQRMKITLRFESYVSTSGFCCKGASFSLRMFGFWYLNLCCYFTFRELEILKQPLKARKCIHKGIIDNQHMKRIKPNKRQTIFETNEKSLVFTKKNQVSKLEHKNCKRE